MKCRSYKYNKDKPKKKEECNQSLCSWNITELTKLDTTALLELIKIFDLNFPVALKTALDDCRSKRNEVAHSNSGTNMKNIFDGFRHLIYKLLDISRTCCDLDFKNIKAKLDSKFHEIANINMSDNTGGLIELIVWKLKEIKLETVSQPDHNYAERIVGQCKSKEILSTFTEKITTIVVVAVAGNGKSRLVKELEYQWRCTNPYFLKLDSYDLLVIINVRDLRGQGDLMKNLTTQFPSINYYDEKYLTAALNRIKILLILDGYDESCQQSHEHIKRMLTRGKKLGWNCILTTRPSHVQTLIRNLKKMEVQYSKCFIHPFQSTEERKTFYEIVFDEKSSYDSATFHMNEEVEAVLNTPEHLMMLNTIVKSGKNLQFNSVYSLYFEHFRLIEADVQGRIEEELADSSIVSYKAIDRVLKFAATLLIKVQVEIPKATYFKFMASLTEIKEINWSMVMSGVVFETVSESSGDVCYNFRYKHLTHIEFMSALALMNLLEDNMTMKEAVRKLFEVELTKETVDRYKLVLNCYRLYV